MGVPTARLRAFASEQVPLTWLVVSGGVVVIMTCNHSTPFEIIAFLVLLVPILVYLQPRSATPRHPPVVIKRRSEAPAVHITLPHLVVVVCIVDFDTNNVTVPILFAWCRGFSGTCRILPRVEIPIFVVIPITEVSFFCNLIGGIRRRVVRNVRNDSMKERMKEHAYGLV